MAWKKVNEVKVGSKIDLPGGGEYEVVGNSINDLTVRKAGSPLSQKAKDIVERTGDDWKGHNHFVWVQSEPGTNLTEQLRDQLTIGKKLSLTEQLRNQLAEGNGKTDYGHYGQATAKADPRVAQQDVKIGAVNAKVDTLRGQVAQTALRANEAVYGVKAVADAFEQHAYEHDVRVTNLEETVECHLEEADEVLDDVHELIGELQERIGQLEDDVEKRQLQDRLNEAIARNKTTGTAQGGNVKMKNLLSGFKVLFGKVEGIFALSIFGGVAIRKGLGAGFVSYDKTNGITDVQDNVLKFDVPAFKLPVAAKDVKKGDIVVNAGSYQYVTDVVDGYVKTINPVNASLGTVLPVRNAILNQAFYTVVKVIDFTAGQTEGFNPMLLMALSGDGKKDDILPLLLASGGLGGGQAGALDPTMLMFLSDSSDDLLPLLLLQQGGFAKDGINPLMLLAMSDKGGKGKDLLPLLLMSQGGAAGQAGGLNPLMLMAMSGDGGTDMKDIFMLQALTGQSFGAPATPAKDQPKA